MVRLRVDFGIDWLVSYIVFSFLDLGGVLSIRVVFEDSFGFVLEEIFLWGL